jgi:hypothetical protein
MLLFVNAAMCRRQLINYTPSARNHSIAGRDAMPNSGINENIEYRIVNAECRMKYKHKNEEAKNAE